MNFELLEAFCQNYPEQLDGTLDCISIAVTMSFNKRGTMLAVGCNDGRIVIWDFLTRKIAKIISAHVHPICSVSWSRSGRRLLSSSTDSNVCIWDVLTSDCIRKHRFPSPVIIAQFDPRYEWQFLACPLQHAPLVMNERGQHTVLPLDEDDPNIVAVFDKRGRYVYTGNSKGKISVLDARKFRLRASFRILAGTGNPSAIKSIEYSRKGNWFLVNAADRIIRVYDAKKVLANGRNGQSEPVQKLQDLVNRSMWKKCAFSGDGEFICAGSARQHSVYIWEKSSGSLVKILHGAIGDIFLDVVWHPLKPIVASNGSGLISIWAQNHFENWSAFAPGFKELDENVEYEERESEFDIEDEDKSQPIEEEKDEASEDGDVDIMTIDVGSDSESDHVEFEILPLAPDIEMPEEWETVTIPRIQIPKDLNDNVVSSSAPVSKDNSVYPRVGPIVETSNNGLKLTIKLGGCKIEELMRE